MKQAVTLILCGFATVLFSQNSHAVMDDGFALKNRSVKKSNSQVAKTKLNKTVKSKNQKKMVASSAKSNKNVVLQSIQAVRRSLGAVPMHIQRHWGLLTKDQKEIVYSYHNEKPYSEIDKKHFQEIAKARGKKLPKHETAFGFDNSQQASLDVLRSDINGETITELSDETQVIVEALAAIEDRN